MVVSRHIGQLGNSFFQICAALGYARKHGYEWATDYNVGMGEPYSKIHKVFPNLPKHELNGTRHHEHPNDFCRLHGTHFNECHFDYHPIPNLGPNVTLTGFYQSWKYFEGQDEEIRKVFALPHVEGYEDYVSIHVRRGDYVTHAASFPPVTLEYITKAMVEVRHKLDYPERMKFIFFSDDISWCKETFKDSTSFHYEYSEGRTELEDLSLMASCGHHIIANSTFSWMAAYLGHNPDRIVVSPSCKRGQWFGMNSGVKKDCVDLLPSHWHQITFR